MSRPPRIWFFNRSYWPDSEATGQLLTELCEDLVDDFEVTVFVGHPNHTQTDQAAGAAKRRGVTIQRLPHTRFNKSSTVGRLANLLTFTASAFLGTLFRSRPDLVVTETDPFFLPLLGRWLKFRYRCRFVAYLQDVYPDIAIAVGRAREGWLTRFLRRRLVGAYESADRVVVVCERMLARCRQQGVSSDRLAVVHNWADCRRIVPIKNGNQFRRVHGWDDKFLVVYSGNLGLASQLGPVLEAANLLRDDDRFQFVFIGEGVRKAQLMHRAGELELQNVAFLTYQPLEFLSHSLSAADVQIVSLLPATQGCVMPSKLYGILAAGTPVLALCPDGDDLSRIVREFDIGRVCPVDDDESGLAQRLANQLQEMQASPELLARQGMAARALAERQYDRLQQVRRFAQVIHEVLRQQRQPVSNAAKSSRNSGRADSDWQLVGRAESQRDTADVPIGETIEFSDPVAVDSNSGPSS
ncbi:MAG: glycosyltransferase family 4 protein [Planctomycetaceae bacterium]